MMVKESDIMAKCSKRTPFTVPEGYFDSLTERIMEKIPDDGVQVSAKPNRSRIIKFFTWSALAVAACFVGVMVCQQFMKLNDGTEKQLMQQNMRAQVVAEDIDLEEDYSEDVLNYAMVDNNDVYCYLSGDGF